MKDSTIIQKNKQRRERSRWIAVIFWLAVWIVAYQAVGEPLLLPSPLAVFSSIVRLVVTFNFWTVTVSSLLRILAGFLLGLLLGALLAALSAAFPAIRATISLPLNVIKATPVASFVILAMLFIKGQFFSAFIAFLMVLPLAWSNILQGIESTDKELLEMARVFRFPWRDTIHYIYLPSLFPYLMSAARVGMGFAWKAGIAGEVIAVYSGTIGTQLYNAKVYLETEELFAWTVVIILLSLLLERVTLDVLEWISDTPVERGGRGA